MADRLERLLNLTATLLDTRRPLTLDELAERVEPRDPEDKTACRRQFERDKETLRELGVPITVEIGRRHRRRPGVPHRPEGVLPAGAVALRHRARRAPPRGHRGAARRRRGSGRARQARRPGGGGRRRGHGRSRGDAGRRRAVRRGEPAGADHVLVPRRHAAAPAVRRRAAVGSLVRRRARRRTRRAARRSGSIASTASRRWGRRGPSNHRRGSTPAKFVRDDPLTYGEDRPVEARVLVDVVARGLGGRAARRRGRRRTPRRRLRRGGTRGRQPRRVPLVGARPARSCRGASVPTSCAPTSSRGSARSWTPRREPAPARRTATATRARARSLRARAPRRAPSPSSPSGSRSPRPSSNATSNCCRSAGCRRTPPTASWTCGWSTARSRSDSPSTSSGRCASRPRKAWRCSPPGARCCRSRARIHDGPLATALDKLDVALDAGGRLAVHVGGSDHLEELQDAASASEQVEIDYYSFARDEMTTRSSIRGGSSTRSAPGTWPPGATGRTPSGCSASIACARSAPRASTSRTRASSSEPENGPSDAAELVYRPRPEHLRVSLRLAPSADWVVESYPARSRRAVGRRLVAGRARGQRAGLAGTPPPRARARRRRGRPTEALPGGARRRGAHPAPLPLSAGPGPRPVPVHRSAMMGAVEQRL